MAGARTSYRLGSRGVTVDWSTEWLNSLIWIVVVTVPGGARRRRRAGSWWPGSPCGAASSAASPTPTSRPAAGRAGGRCSPCWPSSRWRWRRCGCRWSTPTSSTAFTPRCRTATRRRFGRYVLIFAILSVVALAQALARLLRAAAAHPALAGLAQRPHRRRLARRPGLPPGPLHARPPVDNPDQRIQQDITSFIGDAADARRRRDQRDGVAGVVHRDPLAAVGPAHGVRARDPAGDDVRRLPLRHRRDADRLPHRPAADPAQLPARRS